MNRRRVLQQLGITAGLAVMGPTVMATCVTPLPEDKKRVLRIANITDIHMTPENAAPERFLKCMEDIKVHKVDFFLNGGDTIMAADYDDKTREQVNMQWDTWQRLRKSFDDYEMYACLGNHDMWWAAPSKEDPMYGKPFAQQQLGMPDRYYSFQRNGWHFIVLDSNNANAGSLDEEQRQWLENTLAEIPENSSVLVMSHYPILGVSTIMLGGNHTDGLYITDLFYKHKDKRIHCISGHMHLLDKAVYNDVHYFCNGSMSGFWWGEGDENSAGKNYYYQTPPGYCIIDLYEGGEMVNTYYPHAY
ncbi:metallophosphoesterase [Robertkochia solimangrovi]|nr:metallophosphoesterase [Robertkochia solimangrovi]